MAYREFPEEQNTVNEPDYSASYTAADYLKWQFEGLFELIKGKAFKMSPSPSSSHQVVARELSGVLFKFFQNNPCQFFFAPFDVYLLYPGEDHNSAKNVVAPDICVICDPSKIRKRGCVGAPDLVIEIVSPATKLRDLTVKYDLYEEYGVREYWIVHPQDKTVQMNVLENGKYVPQRLLTEGQFLYSVAFPDLTVNLSSIFPENEPED